jgi:hypothetical protein
MLPRAPPRVQQLVALILIVAAAAADAEERLKTLAQGNGRGGRRALGAQDAPVEGEGGVEDDAGDEEAGDGEEEPVVAHLRGLLVSLV